MAHSPTMESVERERQAGEQRTGRAERPRKYLQDGNTARHSMTSIDIPGTPTAVNAGQ